MFQLLYCTVWYLLAANYTCWLFVACCFTIRSLQWHNLNYFRSCSLIFDFFDFCRQRSLTQQWYLVFYFTACPSSQHLIFCSLWALLWQRGFYTCQGILSDIINNNLWELSINYPLYVRQCFKVSGHVVTFKSQVFNKQVSQTVLPP